MSTYCDQCERIFESISINLKCCGSLVCYEHLDSKEDSITCLICGENLDIKECFNMLKNKEKIEQLEFEKEKDDLKVILESPYALLRENYAGLIRKIEIKREYLKEIIDKSYHDLIMAIKKDESDNIETIVKKLEKIDVQNFIKNFEILELKDYPLDRDSVKSLRDIIEKPKLYQKIDNLAVHFKHLLRNDIYLKENFSSKDHILKGIQIVNFNSPNNVLDIADLYFKLGELFTDIKDFNSSLEYHLKCFEIRTKHLEADNTLIADSSTEIGLVYNKLKDKTNALEYCKKGFDIMKEKNHPLLSTIYWLFGDLNKNDTKLEYFKKSLEIREKLFPRIKNIDTAILLYQTGLIYSKLKETDKYEKCLISSSEILKDIVPPYFKNNDKTNKKSDSDKETIEQVIYFFEKMFV